MKRFLALFMALAMLVCLPSCGNEDGGDETTVPEESGTVIYETVARPGSETEAEPIVAEPFSADAAVGDVVYFGKYVQSADATSTFEDIRWAVVGSKDGKLLLLSLEALEVLPYNTEDTGVTWSDSTARAWLNNEFYNAAFSDAEKAMIADSVLDVTKNPEHDYDSEVSTVDKVFLISVEEFDEYVKDSGFETCKPTAYALTKEPWVSVVNGNCWWWMRTPGMVKSNSMGIDATGAYRATGNGVEGTDDCIRPAIWVSIE